MEKRLVDRYHYEIEKGSYYIEVNYFEKDRETKNGVVFKDVKRIAYVLPNTVMSPLVTTTPAAGGGVYH